jgi:tRNA dimethylallyltransferase
LSKVPHHFISSHSINESYDAGTYGREAIQLIYTLFEKLDYLILCGGSGLYVKAVLEGFDEMPEIPPGTREKIMEEYQTRGLEWLQAEVKSIDPDYFEIVDINNPHRLIRALELHRAIKKPLHQLRLKKKMEHPFQVVKIGLELERTELYKRIDDRMDNMIAAGLFDEANRFFVNKDLNALQTVGYREIFGFMEGAYDRKEAIRLLKRNTRQYAKRQQTWFRRDQEITWFHPSQIESIINHIEEKR